MSHQALVGASEDMRLIERFTRVDADAIEYRFTIEDPKTWTRSWSAEVPFVKMEIQAVLRARLPLRATRRPRTASVARFRRKRPPTR